MNLASIGLNDCLQAPPEGLADLADVGLGHDPPELVHG